MAISSISSFAKNFPYTSQLFPREEDSTTLKVMKVACWLFGVSVLASIFTLAADGFRTLFPSRVTVQKSEIELSPKETPLEEQPSERSHLEPTSLPRLIDILVPKDEPITPDLPLQAPAQEKFWTTKKIVLAGAAVLGVAALGIYGWQRWNSEPPYPTIKPDPSVPQVPITVFTSYTTDNSERLAMSRSVAQNQADYCRKNGYEYQLFEENLAGEGVLPYWSKVAGIRQLLQTSKSETIVWVDDDAVIGNQRIKLEDFIKSHGGADPDTHIVVTRDSMTDRGCPTMLNTGVLIVKNSDFSRKFFDALWKKRNDRVYQYTLATCPAQRCLHEQQAMHNLLKDYPNLIGGPVKIIPQRGADGIGINTFSRFDHYDDNRNGGFYQYENDPQETRYQKGDFITQCTGLATRGRREGQFWPSNLRKECIDDLLKRVSG